MKKMMLSMLAIIIVAGFANVVMAEDWYAITAKNSCAKASEILFRDIYLFGYSVEGPTDVIKAYREQEVPYKIEEKTVNGKVVEVTITNRKNYYSTTFYRFGRCKEVLKSIQTKEDEELKRYK